MCITKTCQFFFSQLLHFFQTARRRFDTEPSGRQPTEQSAESAPPDGRNDQAASVLKGQLATTYRSKPPCTWRAGVSDFWCCSARTSALGSSDAGAVFDDSGNMRGGRQKRKGPID